MSGCRCRRGPRDSRSRVAQAEHAGAGVHPADECRHRPAAHVGKRVRRVVARDHQQALHQLADGDVLVRLQVDAGLPDPQPRFPDRDRVGQLLRPGRERDRGHQLGQASDRQLEVRAPRPHHPPGLRVDHDAAADVDALHPGGRRVAAFRGGSAAFSWRAALGCPCPPSEANGSGHRRHDGAQRLAARGPGLGRVPACLVQHHAGGGDGAQQHSQNQQPEQRATETRPVRRLDEGERGRHPSSRVARVGRRHDATAPDATFDLVERLAEPDVTPASGTAVALVVEVALALITKAASRSAATWAGSGGVLAQADNLRERVLRCGEAVELSYVAAMEALAGEGGEGVLEGRLGPPSRLSSISPLRPRPRRSWPPRRRRAAIPPTGPTQRSRRCSATPRSGLARTSSSST